MATAVRLIYDTSEKNADLYYATRFLAPDAFLFLEIRDSGRDRFDNGKRHGNRL